MHLPGRRHVLQLQRDFGAKHSEILVKLQRAFSKIQRAFDAT